MGVDFKHSHHSHNKEAIWGDGCVDYLDLGNDQDVYVHDQDVYVHVIITLYTLNINNYICQLFPNKV